MKRFLVVASLALALFFGVAGAQTLVFGQSGLPVTLDSADAQDGNSLTVARQITEKLIDFVPGTTDLAPGLALSWSSNDDATVWTFTLRQGVRFHDGTPFDAAAVKFNFDRWNDPNHPYHLSEEGKTYVPWSEFIFGGFLGEGSLVSEVRVVDEFTVEFHLTEPAGIFPAMIAAIYFQIDSPAAVMAAGGDYGTPGVGTVGTGPFKFVEWIEGERVVLERNDDYWGEVPKVERLVFRGIQDPTARLAELRAGTIDIAVNLASDDLPTVESDPNLVPVIAESELNIGYLAMHQAHAPFDNPLVREAVAYAIDREAIVDAFYAGLGSVAKDFLPPTMWGHADVEARPYDPERSRVLLREAGFPDGFDTELWFMPVSRPYYPSPEPIATAMATFLADVGINVELKTVDWGTYLQQYREGAFPMYMLGWNADYADPDNFLNTFFNATAQQSNYGWSDDRTARLLSLARQSGDQTERQRLYAEVQVRVYDQVPSIPVAHNTALNAVRSNIKNFQPSPLGTSEIPLNLVEKQ